MFPMTIALTHDSNNWCSTTGVAVSDNCGYLFELLSLAAHIAAAQQGQTRMARPTANCEKLIKLFICYSSQALIYCNHVWHVTE